MKILNVLFSSNLGGMEQAFIDYTEALIHVKNKVVCIVKTDAPFVKELEKVGAKVYKVKNRFGYMDYLLIMKLRWIARMEGVDVAIAHAGRAMSLVRRAVSNVCPVVCVNHSSNVKRSIGSDAVFVINNEAKKVVLAKGQAKNSVFLIPNMIRIPKVLPKKKLAGKTIVVGSLGRFVKAKGFDKLIEAIWILKTKGVNVKLVLAGDGEEKENLIELCKEYDVEKEVKLVGWVTNISSFFKMFDIFCLSSRFEPFGIVLLQAMLHKKAIVTTNCEAVKDIFKHNEDAIIVSKDNEEKMAQNIANGIQLLLKDKRLRNKLSMNGHKKMLKIYSMNSVGSLLNKILSVIVKKHKNN